MKKAMVLQDIKNTSGSDSDPPPVAVGNRKKKARNKQAKAGNDQLQDTLSVSSPGQGLNLPLLQRILAKQKSEEEAMDSANATDEPEDTKQATAEVKVDPAMEEEKMPEAENTRNMVDRVSEIEILPADDAVSIDEEDSIQVPSVLEHTSANDGSLNQAFCNMTNIDASIGDSQLNMSTGGASLLCTEKVEDLDTTPKPDRTCTMVKAGEEVDKLSDVASSTLMSPDIMQIAEGFCEDSQRQKVPKITENPHPVCALSQLDENTEGPETTGTCTSQLSVEDSKNDIPIVNTTITLKSVSGHSETNVSTPKDLLDDLDLEVGSYIGARESKHKKASRRRSQQVMVIPQIPEESGPDRTDHSSQDKEMIEEPSPALCIINDRRSRGRGKRKRRQPDASTSESSCDSDRSGTDISDSTSGTLSSVEPSEMACSVNPTERVCSPEATPSAPVCIISERGARGRKKRSPPTTTMTTTPTPVIEMSDISPTENTELPDDSPETNVVSINDAPRGRQTKRRKRGGRDTPSPELSPQNTVLDTCESTQLPPACLPVIPVDVPQAADEPDSSISLPQLSPKASHSGFTAVIKYSDTSGSIVSVSRRGRKRKTATLNEDQAQKTSPTAYLSGDSPDLPTLKPNEMLITEEQQESVTGQYRGLEQPVVEENLLDDIDFGERFPVVERPKHQQQKRRRRSADFDVLNNVIPSSPDLQDNMEELGAWAENQMPSRRSKRLRRKSLDLYRASISRAKEEDEEKRRQSIKRELQAVETEVTEDGSVDSSSGEEKDQEEDRSTEPLPVETKPVETDTPLQTEQDLLCTEEPVSQTETPGESHRPRRTPKPVLIQIPEDTAASSVESKAKRMRKKKGNEPSVEDIYLNKLWRTQMPKDKVWETIFEAPKFTKFGIEEYMSNKRLKRQVNFDDFYATNRLKRRRQKAQKLGWKPMTEKKDLVAAANLEEKLRCLDRDMSCLEEEYIERQKSSAEIKPTVSVQYDSASNTPEQVASNSEDNFYTPVQSASNLLQFGQLDSTEQSSTNSCASAASADSDPSFKSARGDRTAVNSSHEGLALPKSQVNCLQVPRQKGVLQPKDIIKQNWMRKTAVGGPVTLLVPTLNLGISANRSTSTTADTSGESPRSLSGVSWADKMLSEELREKTGDRNSMWDDTAEGSLNTGDEDGNCDIKKKRKDTPYLPKFQNQRPRTASASYTCSSPGNLKVAEKLESQLLLAPRSNRKAKKSLLSDFPSTELPLMDSVQFRCSSMKEEEGDQVAVFGSNVSPITCIKPLPNSAATTSDDAVFTDGTSELEHNQPMIDEDWGKRYSGDYSEVVPQDVVLSIVSYNKEANDDISLQGETSKQEKGRDSSNSMLEYVIKVSKDRLHEFNASPTSNVVSVNPAISEDDSSYYIVDHLGKCPETAHQESITDIFAPNDKAIKTEVYAVENVADYNLTGLFSPKGSESHPQRQGDLEPTQSFTNSSHSKNLEAFCSDTIPLHYDNVIKAATEDDSRYSDATAEKDKSLQALLEEFEHKHPCDGQLEKVEASLSDSEEVEPLRMLQEADAENVRNKIDLSANSEAMSPVYGEGKMKIKILDIQDSHKKSPLQEAYLGKKSLVFDAVSGTAGCVVEPLGYVEKPEEVSRAEKYIPDMVAECKEIQGSSQVKDMVSGCSFVFRTDPVHYPDATASFSDSSSTGNSSSALNIDSLIEDHLLSPEARERGKDGRNANDKAGRVDSTKINAFDVIHTVNEVWEGLDLYNMTTNEKPVKLTSSTDLVHDFLKNNPEKLLNVKSEQDEHHTPFNGNKGFHIDSKPWTDRSVNMPGLTTESTEMKNQDTEKKVTEDQENNPGDIPKLAAYFVDDNEIVCFENEPDMDTLEGGEHSLPAADSVMAGNVSQSTCSSDNNFMGFSTFDEELSTCSIQGGEHVDQISMDPFMDALMDLPFANADLSLCCSIASPVPSVERDDTNPRPHSGEATGVQRSITDNAEPEDHERMKHVKETDEEPNIPGSSDLNSTDKKMCSFVSSMSTKSDHNQKSVEHKSILEESDEEYLETEESTKSNGEVDKSFIKKNRKAIAVQQLADVKEAGQKSNEPVSSDNGSTDEEEEASLNLSMSIKSDHHQKSDSDEDGSADEESEANGEQRISPNDKVCIVSMDNKMLLMLDSPVMSATQQMESRQYRQQQVADYDYYHAGYPGNRTPLKNSAAVVSWSKQDECLQFEDDIDETDSEHSADSQGQDKVTSQIKPISEGEQYEAMVIDMGATTFDDDDNCSTASDIGKCVVPNNTPNISSMEEESDKELSVVNDTSEGERDTSALEVEYDPMDDVYDLTILYNESEDDVGDSPPLSPASTKDWDSDSNQDSDEDCNKPDLTENEKQLLLLDSPNISAARQESNRLYRNQQLEDYAYYMAGLEVQDEDCSSASSITGEMDDEEDRLQASASASSSATNDSDDEVSFRPSAYRAKIMSTEEDSMGEQSEASTIIDSTHSAQEEEESNEEAFINSTKISASKLKNLLLDPPDIPASRLEANRWFRQEQVQDYVYFNEELYVDAAERECSTVVSWRKRLLQLILYDEDIWCNSLDTTVEYDSGHGESEDIAEHGEMLS